MKGPLNGYEWGAGSSAVLQYVFYFLFLFASPLVSFVLEFLRIYSVGILNLPREFYERGYCRYGKFHMDMTCSECAMDNSHMAPWTYIKTYEV